MGALQLAMLVSIEVGRSDLRAVAGGALIDIYRHTSTYIDIHRHTSTYITIYHHIPE